MIGLSCQNLKKRYGATRALDGLDLELTSGMIVGVAGPNGAGKSTLMRMLAGEEMPDSGEIVLTRKDGPVNEVWRRVAVVHQEPQVWPNMTVEQNLAVGREKSWFGKIGIDPKAAETVMRRLGILQYRDSELSDLSLAVRQRVEIARAMLSDADVYLFDEPNSALTEHESHALFATMAELAEDDRVVILITHRLNDFVRCCKRVLVLRDGRIAGELVDAEVTETAIAAQLAALRTDPMDATPATRAHDERAFDSTVLLSLEGCSDYRGLFKDITLDLWRGRVLALAGVEGSGARELAQALGGYRDMRQRDGAAFARKDVSMSYLAASRGDTVFRNMTVGENLVSRLGHKALCGRTPLLDPARIEEIARSAVGRYRVKTGGTSHPITSLSGGNQQKVVLGAVMEHGANIIVIEEPTRGVDISSKADIYELLRNYSRRGNGVLVFCTEVQEIFDVADEVIVLSRGRISGRLDVSEFDNMTVLAEQIAHYENA